jgi:rubrerythrin
LEAIGTPEPYDPPIDPVEEFFYMIIGLLFFLFIAAIPLLFIVWLLTRKKKPKKTSPPPIEPIPEIEKTIAPPVSPSPVEHPAPISIKSAFSYLGAIIQYKIKVENNSSEPIGDIKVMLFTPDVFLAKEREKSISMLEPEESKTVTFELRPTGECGDCMISGSIEYYDYGTKKRSYVEIDSKLVSIVCPVLTRTEIDEDRWRQATNELIKAEEDSKDLDIPAENLFDMVTRVLKDMNLYMITPEITSTPQLFTGVARFYAEGVAGLRYAAYVEVVGKRKSRLILKAWAEKEESLTGFYHKMLEEIEKRTDIKIFVDEGVYQYNISTTTIKDSVVQRSKIDGIGVKKGSCPKCGHNVEGDEKYCMECGEKLE